MKKLLYITYADSVHDQRFMRAMADSPYHSYVLRVCTGEWPTPTGVRALSPMGFSNPLAKVDEEIFLENLSSVLEDFKPDLVQVGPLHDLAYLAAKAGTKRILAQSWGFDLMHDSFNDAESVARTHFALAHADALLVDAHAAAVKAIELGLDPNKIVEFPWGVDLHLFQREKFVEQAELKRANLGWQDNIVLFCLRSWEPKYGVLPLLHGFAEAYKLNSKLRLVLANSGSQKAAIEDSIEQLDLKDLVYLPGRLPNNELPLYFSMADLYVSPSFVDGSSVSLMEALACSLPALVSRIPTNQEWVWEGENGCFFEPGNEHEISEAILKAAQTDLTEMCRRSRAIAEKKANWERNQAKLFAIWKALLEKEK